VKQVRDEISKRLENLVTNPQVTGGGNGLSYSYNPVKFKLDEF